MTHKIKKLLNHRVFPTAFHGTVLLFCTALYLGLYLTAVVLLFNPYFLRYIRKVFTRV